MKSLRNAIRRAVLAVPVATTACMGSGGAATTTAAATGSGPTSSATATTASGSGSDSSGSGFGSNLCSGCAAQGLVCNPWGTACINPLTIATATGGDPATASTAAAAATSATAGTGTSGSATASGSTSTSGTPETSGSSGSTGEADCPSYGLCTPICDCMSTIKIVAPIAPSLYPDGSVGFCHCEKACGPLPDGGLGPLLPDGGPKESRLTGCGAEVMDGGAADGGELWALSCYYYTSCNGGRRPTRLVEPSPRARSGLGAYFARLAHLEAASVLAFRRLARQLASLEAPVALIRKARIAARDEIRHARLTRRLADRFGGVVPPVEAAAEESITLEELARENAREGCVGETFGAAVAEWQARHATDLEVRGVAERLRDDEITHAELAWEIDAWAQPLLSVEERARIESEKRAALRRLEQAADESQVELPTLAGIPQGSTYRALIASLRAEVWSAVPA